MSQSKYWCFTLNNYDGQFDYISHLMLFCTYAVFGYERGEREGTPHLQGYCEFPKRKRLSGVRKVLTRARWSTRISDDPSKAADYCKKDGDFEEAGAISESQQGKRTDLEFFTDELKAGKSLADVAEEAPSTFVKHHRGLQAFETLMRAKKEKNTPRVSVYWGETGTGKSYLVRCRSPQCFFTSNCKWYDGYDGCRDICFDDYAGGIKIDNFLRLIDRYPVHVETKGGTLFFNPKNIYITSHFHPECWYPEQRDRNPELMRRIHVVREFKSSGTGTEVGGNNGHPLQDQVPVYIYVDDSATDMDE